MAAPHPSKQKNAWSAIDGLFAKPKHVWVVHYSCESFYERPSGTSPRITSIAVRNLDSGQTRSFSIHQVAEQEGVPLTELSDRFDELERLMLEGYFDFVSRHSDVDFLHWNMRDINYGFAALEHRFRVLGGEPVAIEDESKFDLSRLLIDIYGVGYIGHPRLENLLKKNSIKPRDFLNGHEEAAAFDRRDYVALHQSTLRKVDIIANLAERTRHRQLKTETTWWEMHGGTVRTVGSWIAQHWVFTLLSGLVGIIAAVWAIIPWLTSLL